MAMPTINVRNPNDLTEGQGNLGAELAAKKAAVDEYKGPNFTADPARKTEPVNAAVDRINPKAQYGARAGEQRIDTSDMTKPLGGKGGAGTLPVYDQGGKVNVHDGKHQTAILKDGERVLTEKQDKEYKKMKDVKDKMKSALSDEDGQKPKKEIKEMVHRKSSNGKHIIVHKHHHPAHHPDEEHVMNDMAELHNHMENHAGTPNDGEEAGEGEQPAQMTAAPSAPAPAPEAMPGQ